MISVKQKRLLRLMCVVFAQRQQDLCMKFALL